jgi:hypothetical protein
MYGAMSLDMMSSESPGGNGTITRMDLAGNC